MNADPVGMLRMDDEAGEDTKLLAVPIDRLTSQYRGIRSPRAGKSWPG